MLLFNFKYSCVATIRQTEWKCKQDSKRVSRCLRRRVLIIYLVVSVKQIETFTLAQQTNESTCKINMYFDAMKHIYTLLLEFNFNIGSYTNFLVFFNYFYLFSSSPYLFSLLFILAWFCAKEEWHDCIYSQYEYKYTLLIDSQLKFRSSILLQVIFLFFLSPLNMQIDDRFLFYTSRSK